MQHASSNSVRVYYPRYDTEWLVQELKKRLNELNEELSTSLIVLFGSYAKGTHTVASDVDLLVVYQGARREDAYATVKRIINIPRLEPHVYTEQEHAAMRGVLSKMIASGIVIEP